MPPHHTPISRLYLAHISPISRLYLAREPGAQVRNLDLAAYTQLSEEDQAKGVQTKFNLMSSTQHDGQPESGTYRTYVHFKANDQWSAVAPPPHAPCDAPLASALLRLSCCAEAPYSRALPRSPQHHAEHPPAGTTSRTCTSTASTRSSSLCPSRTSRSTTRPHHEVLYDRTGGPAFLEPSRQPAASHVPREKAPVDA